MRARVDLSASALVTHEIREMREINEIREISSIEFGLYSEAEILKMSVCKIDNPKKQGYGTVYDERMGTTDSSKICETCGQNAEKCPGHFGHIELNEPIIHTILNYCSTGTVFE